MTLETWIAEELNSATSWETLVSVAKSKGIPVSDDPSAMMLYNDALDVWQKLSPILTWDTPRARGERELIDCYRGALIDLVGALLHGAAR